MKKTTYLAILLLLFCNSYSQQTLLSNNALSDTLKQLDEVMIRAFEQNRKPGTTATSVSIIDFNNGDRNNKSSLVNGFNTIPGVRMEERSPGSYRINMRGSSLRSPFGIRNVKVYWNEIPITDPGGNTYFNQFAYNNFSYLEILKGPAGSIYGAGTGGLILMHNLDRWQPGISLEYLAGSYNLQNIFTSARFGNKENKNQFTYAHNQSDGYRVHTQMRRDNFTWQSELKVSEKQQISASVLFTDMYYQTPGALTLAEYTANPKAARPAAGAFPSSVDAKAAIFQKNITAGFTNTYVINSSLKNSTTLYGTFSQIKNSAVRNYERRNEPGFGGRTVFVFNKPLSNKTTLQLVGGSEFQKGYFNTQVSKNKNGTPDTLQTNDDIDNTTYNFFIQGDISMNAKLFINAGVSLNKTEVGFTRLSQYPVLTQSRSYKNEFAPRISIRKLFTDNIFLIATVSRGFSPPTIGELLPSTGVISIDLEAENGWNYELGAGYTLLKKRLRLEATGFYFDLKNALVQRRDLSGADFFVNAGNIKQKGLEFSADYSEGTQHGLIAYYTINAAYTYNHFRYGTFIKGTNDFSGKTVPSVPSNTLSILADAQLKNGIYANLTFYTASKIFLNDANTAVAEDYQLLGCRIGWKKLLQSKYKLNFYAGADNLLDETYSLGNDINAAANRFYNAAPNRNYYIGVSFQWIKTQKN